MKLSFSLPSKPSSSKPTKQSQGFNADKEPRNNAKNHEYVTEFDASKTLAAPDPKKIIIPPKENEWRPFKKMKNLNLPPLRSSSSSDAQGLQFEVESSDNAPDHGSQMSYGLNVRESNGKGDADEPNSVEGILLKKLRSDLDRLPDDEGFEQFDEVPVDGFGAALLAGYGWHEGRGVGRNAKEDVKVIEYKRRTAKEGLGFTSDHGANGKIGDDGGKKIEKEGKREKLGFSVGEEVRIIGGRDVGLKGRVVKVLSGGDSLVLRRSRTEEEVKVSVNEVAELGSVEEDKCLKKLKELKIQASRDDKSRSEKKSNNKDKGGRESKRSREEGRTRAVSEVEHERVHREERRKDRVSWLTTHIRVRVISKEFKGGRFYLKKGEIVDVVGPRTCDISMDDGRELVQGVDLDILETALPRRGGPVLVLLGKHKGAYGSLVERDTEKEMGVVQDADTRELLHVRLGQIAEYIGDPSYIGY